MRTIGKTSDANHTFLIITRSNSAPSGKQEISFPNMRTDVPCKAIVQEATVGKNKFSIPLFIKQCPAPTCSFIKCNTRQITRTAVTIMAKTLTSCNLCSRGTSLFNLNHLNSTAMLNCFALTILIIWSSCLWTILEGYQVLTCSPSKFYLLNSKYQTRYFII